MLDELIAECRDQILEQWFERVVACYPAETATFLRSRQDRFANPVGHSLRAELGGVLDGLLLGPDEVEVRRALDGVLRIRAVQDMPPSAAVGFVLDLKPLIRRAVSQTGEPPGEELWSALDERVDRLLLAAFDVYSACREQVFAIRVEEIRNRSSKVLERLNARSEARGPASRPEAVE